MTRDLRKRLKAHNESRSPHTAKFRPWLLIAYFAFANEKTVVAFERYLKSGSGRHFRLGDVCIWKSAHEIDVFTVNLYSDLLIEFLSKLQRSGWLILSGVLRSQESEFLEALSRNGIERVMVKRRGKWIALLARRSTPYERRNSRAAKFCGGHRPPLQ